MKQHTAEELNKLSKEEIVALLMQAEKQNSRSPRCSPSASAGRQSSWNALGR